MGHALKRLFWWFARQVLGLRYRVRVEGLEQLRGVRHALVLPNHPAYIDPALVFTTIWPLLQARPVMADLNLDSPLLRWIPRATGALILPDTEHTTTDAAAVREQIQKVIATVIAGLDKGDNFIIWPAGRVMREGLEALGSARGVAEILAAAPEAQVVLLRTRGLWGSSLGRAYTGASPNLAKRVVRGILTVLANLLFFTPRRRITITIEKIDRAKLPELKRDKLNRFLEGWYNAPGEEQPVFVPYHLLLGPRTYAYPPKPARLEVDLNQIKPPTLAAIRQMIGEKARRPLTDEEFNPATKLEVIGLDSLETMELTTDVEKRFSVMSDRVPATVGDLLALAQGLIAPAPPVPPPALWATPCATNESVALLGETVGAAFIERALRNRRDVVAADDVAGVVTYEKLLVGTMLLSRRFKKIAAKSVGVLVPASVAADTALLALHLAGKLPVMLNWTAGAANLAHAVKTTGITHIITSRRFIDKIGLSVEGAPFVFMEDARATISKLEMLRALLRVRLMPGSIRRLVPKADPASPAVILFTSGSEKAPKVVPLTHRNILSNMQSLLDALPMTRRDTLLGFLPPFHSFGLTFNAFAPLLGGLRVIHHPDPTDGAGLARKAATYQPTISCGTPSFIGNMVRRAVGEQLKSLRVVVVGAEKCPPALFELSKTKAPALAMMEGYGITECSPLVTCNLPGAAKPGTIGRAVPGVSLMVVDPVTNAPLKTGEMGMLLIAGPNVFPGYMGEGVPSPFHEHDGKRWYISGDLARLDAEGYVEFSGRLKRFIKAGGEMISLPALEEPFVQKFPATDDGPRVALEGVELESGKKIVVFTTEALTLPEANALLAGSGFTGIMRLDEVRRVEKIPVLGSGKTDYKVLRAQIA